VDLLLALKAVTKWTGPDDPVFAGATGRPLWADNLAKRVLKPMAVKLGMPWLSSHVFRHTCATLTKSVGMLDVDRRVLMGHADGTMTDRYTHEDFERMRRGVELVATEIMKAPKTDDPDATADVAPARSNVIEIRRVG
jgi:integrase